MNGLPLSLSVNQMKVKVWEAFSGLGSRAKGISKVKAGKESKAPFSNIPDFQLARGLQLIGIV